MQKRSAALLIGSTVSVIWLAAISFFLFSNNDSVDLYSTVTNMRWNELGDFLAGIFAPLAFFWLVIAVFVQSSQLNSQKEELSLTRQEMALAREIKEEEVNEARQSVKFIGEQTSILKSERIQRSSEFYDNQLSELTSLIHIHIVRLKYIRAIIRSTDLTNEKMSNYENNESDNSIFSYSKLSNEEQNIHQLLDVPERLALYLLSHEWRIDNKFDLECKDVNSFFEIRKIFSTISGLEPSLSPAGKLLFQRYLFSKIDPFIYFSDNIESLSIVDYEDYARQAKNNDRKSELLYMHQPI
ncbi:MAG: hypothetical protein ACE360_03980 [Hyphomicrobiales bacterium]